MNARIIFDLDGTLIDSAKSLTLVGNKILSKIGRNSITEEKYKTFIGDGLKKQVERLLVWSGGIPEDGLEKYYLKFLSIYQSDPVSNLSTFPRAIETIKFLKEKGACMGICTQKLREPSMKILEELKLVNDFDQFAFGDTLAVRKPDPEMINYIMQNDIDGTPTIYVGDSEVDAKTARNAKIPFILFSEGYRKSSISEIKPDFWFSDYANLPAILLNYLGNFD